MMTQNDMNSAAMAAALQWYLDHGVDDLLMDETVDRTVVMPLPTKTGLSAPVSIGAGEPPSSPSAVSRLHDSGAVQDTVATPEMMGAAQAIVETRKLAAAAQTLDELKQAITHFEGLSVRKTATNMVFSDGNPDSSIMLIGEAPSADEDIQGKPFVGESGQLLDKILACIHLSRENEDLTKSVYVSNILNWRPPGNRTPTSAEIDISLPFIERHIALVQPKFLILCGGVAAKSLLRRDDSISKLRGSFHDYQVPEDLKGAENKVIPAMVTYHPAYLLRTPAQKKAVWADMLMFQEELKNL